ncbi:MAG: SynChlorMet cassette protein ScmC [Armatimonadetes bacterium]|nr:SynChlorMet cassette protein ScmC [Armatimonadota bacterium]
MAQAVVGSATISAGPDTWAISAGDDGAWQTVRFLADAMGDLGPPPGGAPIVWLTCDSDAQWPECVADLVRAGRRGEAHRVSLPRLGRTANATPTGNAMVLAGALAQGHECGGLFHGGLVERHGLGMLFCAPGGTGKSTACGRLPAGWHAHCDDTALVLPAAEQGWWAHPWPTWSRFEPDGPGGRWDTSSRVPLRAAFYLEQAERDEIIAVGSGESAARLYAAAEQARRMLVRGLSAEEQRVRRQRWFDDAARLAGALVGYRLRLTRTGHFWELLEPIIAALGRSLANGDEVCADARRPMGV